MCSPQATPVTEGPGACPPAAGAGSAGGTPLAWFAQMVPHCKQYAQAAAAAGRPIVGIMCEYAPRELIMAAGGVPVCLCGGDADTIPSAEAHLPANLCPLIKSTYGYLVEKANPFLEMADLVIAETTCDGKKKMFELMGRARPTYLMELPQKEDDPDAMEHWVRELRKLRAFLQERWGRAITDANLRAAIGVMNRERRLRRRLAELLKADEPPLTGRQLLDLKSIISGIPEDLEQYEKALRLFGDTGAGSETANAPGPQCKAHRAEGLATPPAPRPSRPRPARILLTGVPLVHGAERVMDIIEEHGGLVVCQENCTGLKPILEDVAEDAPDPISALAEKYYHLPCSVRTPNARRLERLRELARDFRAQAVIELIWQACLTYAVEAFNVKRLVEEELRLPYLRIETDYSPSDSARIAVRVEALVETVRAR
jgi:benzoyl-CoA reductase/2-hydroxyglutaryl-CoA dehydratase subunit BcrC/BadD/HgdB